MIDRATYFASCMAGGVGWGSCPAVLRHRRQVADHQDLGVALQPEGAVHFHRATAPALSGQGRGEVAGPYSGRPDDGSDVDPPAVGQLDVVVPDAFYLSVEEHLDSAPRQGSARTLPKRRNEGAEEVRSRLNEEDPGLADVDRGKVL